MKANSLLLFNYINYFLTFLLMKLLQLIASSKLLFADDLLT